MPSVVINRNRAHAVQQLKKGIKSVPTIDGVDGEVQLLGSIANGLIYIGDVLAEIRDTLSGEGDTINIPDKEFIPEDD